MGAARILAENRSAWRGTVMTVFQPGEETAQGARAMIAAGESDEPSYEHPNPG